MKLREILNEGSTDIVARFYKEASQNFNQLYNPENTKYRHQTQEYYSKNFKEWFNEEVIPVFTKPEPSSQKPYSNKPVNGKLQSPGYRGQQYAKARANIPYDHNVQKYDPDMSAATMPSIDLTTRGI